MAENTENSRTANYQRKDLETRLSHYYGPPLTEQPLSSASWEKLRSQLDRHHRIPSKGNHGIKWHGLRGLRRRGTQRAQLPSLIQDSLIHVTNEAGWQERLPSLRCSIKVKAREPRMYVASRFLLGSPIIHITLPLDAPIKMHQAEVDVLLASALARSSLMKQFKYRLFLITWTCLVLLGCFGALYALLHYRFLWEIPVAVFVEIAIAFAFLYQHRKLAFDADTVIVHWLGRKTVCEGLHGLAHHSRKPHRRRLREPSLMERIERVCGTRVTSGDRDLTLVS